MGKRRRTFNRRKRRRIYMDRSIHGDLVGGSFLLFFNKIWRRRWWRVGGVSDLTRRVGFGFLAFCLKPTRFPREVCRNCCSLVLITLWWRQPFKRHRFRLCKSKHKSDGVSVLTLTTIFLTFHVKFILF